jgi:1-acyl-sn-glycerol-3-phosphate acyltransferase
LITLVYAVLKLITRVALAVYFSRIEVTGEEDVPEGPIVLAATHPNAFMDVALVATRLRRRVRFVAKAGLFKNPIGGFLLRTLGAVPVERRLDRGGAQLEGDAQNKNAKSLAACEEAVAEGGAVLIFPEGTSEQVPKLLPLKTGVARIALGAEARRGGVHIVPVAVSYDDPTMFRSRARVHFLPAIPVAPFREMQAQDESRAVHALTAAVRDVLEPRVVHLEDESLAPIVAQVDAIYGATVARQETAGSRLAAAPAIALAVNAFVKASPERVDRVRKLLDRYKEELAAAKLEDRDLRPVSRPRPTAGQNVAMVVGFPFMIWGVLHHWIPYQIPRIVTTALVRDATFVSTIKLITGTVVFLALYVGEGWLAVEWLGLAPGIAWAVSVPVSGIVALEEIEALEARSRRKARQDRRRATPPEKLKELEKLRSEVVGELDRARAEFLLHKAEPAEDGLA